MSVLQGDYTGCAILIYGADGEHLLDTVVTDYDKSVLRIEVEEPPPSLKTGDGCKLLIMTSPSPCEYMGRVSKEGKRFYIALYHGQEAEKRGAERYPVNFPAQIENLVCDGKAHPLQKPLEIELINISKSGIRFRAPNNSLNDGDRFQMRMKIGEGEKLLIADAVHHVDKDADSSEYGCKFLVGADGGKRT